MTNTSRLPVQTTTALLTSAGYNHRKWTKHTYSHSQLTKGKTALGIESVGLGHYFKCTETGEVRLWGFDATFAKDNGGN